MDLLGFYISSIFKDFENYLRTENELVEDDTRLVLDEYISDFITYELEPGFYTLKDLSEAGFRNIQPDYEVFNSSIVIVFDVISMKTKLIVRPGNIAIRFDEDSFISTILGFTPRWDYKHYNENNSQKFTNLNTTNEIHFELWCYRRQLSQLFNIVSTFQFCFGQTRWL